MSIGSTGNSFRTIGGKNSRVRIEVIPGEVELDVLCPDAGTDLGHSDTGLFVQLTARCVFAGLTGADAAAGDLPPRRFAKIDGVFGVHQENACLVIEQYDTGRGPAQCEHRAYRLQSAQRPTRS